MNYYRVFVATVSTVFLAYSAAAQPARLFQEGIPTFSKLETQESKPPNFALLARELSPSVVNISVESSQGGEETLFQKGVYFVVTVTQLPGMVKVS